MDLTTKTKVDFIDAHLWAETARIFVSWRIKDLPEFFGLFGDIQMTVRPHGEDIADPDYYVELEFKPMVMEQGRTQAKLCKLIEIAAKRAGAVLIQLDETSARLDQERNVLECWKNERFHSAGLHISITNEQVFHYSNTSAGISTQGQFKYNSVFDFMSIFSKIGAEFSKEIKESGRQKGFYEIKSDGRIEYRSLPSTSIWDEKFSQRLSTCLSADAATAASYQEDEPYEDEPYEDEPYEDES